MLFDAEDALTILGQATANINANTNVVFETFGERSAVYVETPALAFDSATTTTIIAGDDSASGSVFAVGPTITGDATDMNLLADAKNLASTSSVQLNSEIL